MDIDSVVKYLILIFICVFDPLAICLVVASTHALSSRREGSAPLKGASVDSFVSSNTPVAPLAVNQEPDDVIVQMNFKDENEDKKAV